MFEMSIVLDRIKELGLDDYDKESVIEWVEDLRGDLKILESFLAGKLDAVVRNSQVFFVAPKVSNINSSNQIGHFNE